MANSIYSGLTAGIRLKNGSEATDITFMTGFELEMSQEVMEVITLGDEWKSKYPGIKTWSGNCSGIFTLTDNQKTLFDALTSSDATNSKIELNFVFGENKVLSGNALVSEIKMTVKAEDKTEISFSFEGIGALTEVVSA